MGERRFSFPSGWVVVVAFALSASAMGEELLEFPAKPVDSGLGAFAKAIDGIHAKAVRARKPWTEAELRARVPKRYLRLDDRYARIKNPAQKARALAELALLYAELAWTERIRPIRETLASLDEPLAARLGDFQESEHFVARVVGAEPKWGKAALRLAEAARKGYLERFGFTAVSKTPGKKIRILIHVNPELKRSRLYFHPSPRYHSELRFEVPSEKSLTRAGKQRIVYGFCHELGHMVAMWGKYRVVEDDKHAWAHYTGALVVEDVYDELGNEPWPTWTAFQRKASGRARLVGQVEGRKPGTDSYESILALFYAIGEEFGTESYGKAWSWLEKKKRFRRLNRVPYLWLRDLEAALLATVPRENAARVRELFGSKR